MLLWFLLTAMAFGFVAIDIRSSPVSLVMKWGFVLLTAYTGPIGAFFGSGANIMGDRRQPTLGPKLSPLGRCKRRIPDIRRTSIFEA